MRAVRSGASGGIADPGGPNATAKSRSARSQREEDTETENRIPGYPETKNRRISPLRCFFASSSRPSRLRGRMLGEVGANESRVPGRQHHGLDAEDVRAR